VFYYGTVLTHYNALLEYCGVLVTHCGRLTTFYRENASMKTCVLLYIFMKY